MRLVLEAHREITKEFVQRIPVHLALSYGYDYVYRGYGFGVFAIESEKSLIAQCGRRCYMLRRPGKLGERDQMLSGDGGSQRSR